MIELILLLSKQKELQLLDALSDLASNTYTRILSYLVVGYMLTPEPEKPESEETEMDKEIMKALMLPLPIKSIRRDGNRFIIEIGEESESQE